MFLSRITLKSGAEADPRFFKTFESPYAVHQRVWELFGDHPDRERDFLYRLDMAEGRPKILALSAREPEATWLFEAQSKPFAPALHEGLVLDFSLRLNPTVKRDGKRHDIVMDARHRLRNEPGPLPSREELATQEVKGWLQKRSEANGVEFLDLLVESYEVLNLRRKGGSLRFATCDVQGKLRVREPNAFMHVLSNGLGAQRAFGCGLLLIRRAG